MWYLNQDSLFWGRMLRLWLFVFLCILSWKGPSLLSRPFVSFKMSYVWFCRLSHPPALPSFCRYCIPLLLSCALAQRPRRWRPPTVAFSSQDCFFCVNSKFWSFVSLRSLTGTLTGTVHGWASKTWLFRSLNS